MTWDAPDEEGFDIFGRLRSAHDRLHAFDGSTFCPEFDPVREEFISVRDVIHPMIGKLAQNWLKITDYFLELEHANKHGKVKQKWRGKWQA